MKKKGTDIFLSNHVSFDSAEQKMAALKEEKPNRRIHSSSAKIRVQRFLTVLGECALATKAAVEAKAGK